MKIYLFILYFGNKVHNYFQLYLDSIARNNDTLQVFWVSNYNISHYDVPSNVIFVPQELDSIRMKAADILTKDYNKSVHHSEIIQKPYKLCDFRPLYPAIFEHVLVGQNATEHDFIGFGDFDLIWGKISNLIPQQNLALNHLIGIFGHFTIYRNVPAYKEAYRQLPLDQLISPLSHELDEVKFSTILQDVTIRNDWKILRTEPLIGDVTPWQYRKASKDDRSAEKNMLVTTGQHVDYFYYSNATHQLLQHDAKTGELKEVLYVHLQKRLMKSPSIVENTRLLRGRNDEYSQSPVATDFYIQKYGFSYTPPSNNNIIALKSEKTLRKN